jgi:hypothetical protein
MLLKLPNNQNKAPEAIWLKNYKKKTLMILLLLKSHWKI